MFKNIQIKVKLIFPIVVLTLIFLMLTISLVSYKYSKNQSLVKLDNEIILAIKLSKLLHETQKERGMTVGFITSKGMAFKKQLLLQKRETNKRIKELNSFLDTVDISNISKDVKNILDKALNNIVKLTKVRDSIDALSISSNSVISYYTNLNADFLDTIIEISKISELTNITQNIIAYINFLYYKENAGIERAIGTAILANNNLEQNRINQFNSLIVTQDLYKEIFLKYASNDSKLYYEKNFKDRSIDEVKRMRETILSANKHDILKIDVKYWFNNITSKIDKLKAIDDYLSEEILFNIQNELSSTQKVLSIFIILNIASIIIFLAMIMLILDLIKSEENLKSLIDKYIISSTTNLKGVITDASQAFENISGYSKNELIGKPHNIIRHPDIPKDVFKTMWQTIKQGKTWQGEVKNRHKDGGYYWVYAIISPLYDKGKKIGYSAIRHNITDKKKLEELNKTLEDKVSYEVEKSRQKDKQILQQSRLAQMGEMISMIAHQWRQPLAAISSSSTAINLKATLNKLDKETALELSGNIIDFSKHLSATIDDFREFFRSNKEKRDTTYSDVIQSVLNIVEASISTKNIKIIKELHCNATFSTYPNEIKQVVLNLLKNAEDILLDNRIKDPCIKIVTYTEEEHYILEVSDNGGGIPEDIIDNIFDPYFSTKTKKDGTGLGLYMSKTIIEDHCGGILHVNNSDVGAVFRIMIKVT